MRNLAGLLLTLLVLAPVLPHAVVAASTLRQVSRVPLAVPLESLLIGNRAGVRLLSKADPGYSGNMPINRGIQFGQRISYITVDLRGRFRRLSGMIYNDNASFAPGLAPLDFSAGGSPFYSTAAILTSKPYIFSLDVRGMGEITISKEESQGIYDIVADASTGTPQPATVTVVSPPDGDTFDFGSRVRFAWQPFPGAAAYLVHLWLETQFGAEPITAHTPLTLAATVFHATSYIWNSQGYLAGEYLFQVLPVDGRGANIGKWSTPIGVAIQQQGE